MKNLIIKSITVSALLFSFISCNSDDDSVVENQEDFFNLKVGNKWTYKEYSNTVSTPDTFVYNGFTNTREIVEEKIIDNKKYYKQRVSKVHNINTAVTNYVEYLHVNSEGHLLKYSEDQLGNLSTSEPIVYHSGQDQNLVYNDVREFGIVKYRLEGIENVTIENKNYTIYPFRGRLVSNQNPEEYSSYSVSYNVQKGLGLVQFICPTVGGQSTYEERLISFQSN